MKNKNRLIEMHLRILALFTNSFNKEYYVREISKILKISPRTAQLTLEELERKTILSSTLKGKIKLYKLQNNPITKNYLILTETFKKIQFLEKNDLIKEVIEKISPSIQGIGLIFGSYSKGNQKKDSDLDIFIIKDYDKKEINKISKTYSLPINIKNYSLEIFKKNQEDILIKEMLNSHIIFKNAEEFIGVISEWIK